MASQAPPPTNANIGKIDHMGLTVSNFEKALEFYERILEPLGYKKMMVVEKNAGFGIDYPSFWIGETRDERPVSKGVHVGFNGVDKETVDKWYSNAIAAGATCNGKPGLRPQYTPEYYGAFILDIDGNNIEACFH